MPILTQLCLVLLIPALGWLILRLIERHVARRDAAERKRHEREGMRHSQCFCPACCRRRGLL